MPITSVRREEVAEAVQKTVYYHLFIYVFVILQDEQMLLDCQDAFLTAESFSELKECCLVYVGGFVVRSLRKTLRCTTCAASLVITESSDPKYRLIKMKQYKSSLSSSSGLHFPSQDVIDVIFAAEKVILHLLKLHGGKLPRENAKEVVQCNVLTECMLSRED